MRVLRMLCMHESRGGSWCRLDQGHGELHSDLVLLWDAEGFLCNAEGRSLQEGGKVNGQLRHVVRALRRHHRLVRY